MREQADSPHYRLKNINPSYLPHLRDVRMQPRADLEKDQLAIRILRFSDSLLHRFGTMPKPKARLKRKPTRTSRAQREAQREKVLARNRAYYRAHRGYFRRKQKEWRAKHRQEYLEYCRTYWHTHHARLLKLQRKYRATHRAEHNAANRAYRQRLKERKKKRAS